MANEVRKRKVLVVEHNDDLRFVLSEYLAAQRFDVENTATADEALKINKEFSPDIVLLSRELEMKNGEIGPDGLRVLKLLRQENSKKKRQPIILSAENATNKDFDRYRKLKFSADDYIIKPFEDTEVLRRIENLVGFDMSEGIDHIKEDIDNVMKDVSVFDDDHEEAGISAATRKEVAKLLETVGKELDTDKKEGAPDKNKEKTPPPKKAAKKDGKLSSDQEVNKLQEELSSVNRQMEQVQKQLVSERKRSRELKKQLKKNLQDIAARLKKSEKRENKMRTEFDGMRERFADIELEHTLEMDRASQEKRRIEEELLEAKELLEKFSKVDPSSLAAVLMEISDDFEDILSIDFMDRLQGVSDNLRSITQKLVEDITEDEE